MTKIELALCVVLAASSALGCSRPKAPQAKGEPVPEINEVASKETSARPNVLLIIVDTLRADRLGCYGFEQARTPNIDKLATQGIRVEHAIAPAPITLPSHASILTGFEPPAHGVRDNGTYRLAGEIQTLAEQLKAAGYRTQAFVSAEVLHHRYGLDQGFDAYDDQLWDEEDPTDFKIRERSGERTTDRVLEWLNRRSASTNAADPFFLWVHLFDPHRPYSPPAAYAKGVPTRYDGEIAFVDRQIGRLVEALEQRGVLDDTILVFTSDHGESLGEHDEDTHAVFIYESTVRVPLIFRYPPKLPTGKVYLESVRSVDLMPTILALAGETPNQTQGTDLSKALISRTPPAALPQYSESLHPEVAFGMAPLFGLRLAEWTYIRAPRPELYNRAKDPGEVHDLLDPSNSSGRADAKNQAAKLDALLSKLLDKSKSFGFVAEAKPLDEDTVEMLRALGYMGKSDTSDALPGMDPKDGIQIFAKVAEAFRLIGDDNCRAAVATLRPLLDEAPNLSIARNTIARCEVRMGNLKAAKQQYLKSLTHDPNQDEVLLQLGRIQLSEGDRVGARTSFLQVLELAPESVDAMIWLGYLEQVEGRLEEAKRRYAEAIDADPARPAGYMFHGELYLSQRNTHEAKRWFDKALEVSPRSFPALLQAGSCALGLGAVEEAEGHFLKAHEIDPGAWRPIYRLACTRATTGDTDAALGYLEQAARAGFPNAAQLQADRCFASLSGTPRFERLIQVLGRAAPN